MCLVGWAMRGKSKFLVIFLKNGQIPASLYAYCRLFQMIQFRYKLIKASVDGTQVRGSRIEDLDESTELWWHPILCRIFVLWTLLFKEIKNDSYPRPYLVNYLL